MRKRVVPMIHVPDVAATVHWYRDIGFTVVETYGHDGQQSLRLIAMDEVTFRPLAFDGVTVRFNVADGKTTGFELRDGTSATQLQRMNDD